MTADEVKLNVYSEFLWRKHCACFIEFGGADVWAVKKTLYTVEIEVKVDKYDLLNEIKDIKCALSRGEIKRREGHDKVYKHDSYLGVNRFGVNKLFNENNIIQGPNEFWFAVPTELLEIALDGVRNTPYGVITIGDYMGGYKNQHKFWGYCERLKAKKRHDKKIGVEDLQRLIRKASTENYFLREKLLGKKDVEN